MFMCQKINILKGREGQIEEKIEMVEGSLKKMRNKKKKKTKYQNNRITGRGKEEKRKDNK